MSPSNILNLHLKDTYRQQHIHKKAYANETALYEKYLCGSHLVLRFTADGLEYRAWFRNPDDKEFKAFGPVLDGSRLSIMQGGFTGVMFGMYGSSNGNEGGNSAEYSYFRYEADN